MSDKSSDTEYLNGVKETGEEIVISGIAGRFPDSDNVKHFQDNLFNKVDLVSGDDRRWKSDDPEIPQRTGKINNVGKFDSSFFGVHHKQAHCMDPMCRMLLEHAYEAIIDAGVNPRQLRGTNTGVFIGACFSESEKTILYEKPQINGFGITGCSRAMLANRISYWLGANGPSYCVDSACSSSILALDHAYRAIRSGQCDAALVGACNLCLHPHVSLQYFRLGALSSDGRCKSLDNDANGYARSEAVAVIFLQKSEDAKRIYARVVHAKTNCDGYKEQGITFPSSVMQSALLKQLYEECGVPPFIVSYVEAHGAGTRVGDPEEVRALEKVFCPGRTTPLKIGSVKSNSGHCEAASGLCSITKMIIAMESGFIPPNLHYKRPREGIEALEDGRIQVVSELTPWERGYIGINSSGFGGTNAHVLLEPNPKEKIGGCAPQDNLPRLVVVSGRTEEAVTTLLNDLESRLVDVEYVSLFHEIHSEEIPGHLYRGYTILPPRGLPEPRHRDVQHYPGAKRPVWFVFSGMGSQWAGMGEALMRLPVFAEAIHKCDAALKPHGVDIVDIITNRDESTFDNILNSFVGITALQIGLVDVLSSVGIVPSNIIGHSFGEIGCAYADDCFTAEQTILTSYFRGVVSIETDCIRGSMAAVGLGYRELEDLCPSDIEVACHNGPGSSTISGPADSVKKFMDQLQGNEIFAREVPCGNIAYHSRYNAAMGPKNLAYLQKIIPDPKRRSSKWLSTSVPRNEWSSKLAQLCSPDYFNNNLLSPVLFEETSLLIPNNAITIEIAPHGLLQAILRGSLNEEVTNIALIKRGHSDNVEVLLQAIGKAYEVGLHPQLTNLYPKVEYPVSRGTPMISPLVRWEHSDDWYVASYKTQGENTSGERTVKVTLADEEFEWMAGHVVDGRTLVPATGYLVLIWETLGMMKGKPYAEVSVLFEDVRFHRATILPKHGSLELTLMIHKGSGRFEVVEGGVAVVTGLVQAVPIPHQERVRPDMLPDDEEELVLARKDIYKELRLRGYEYNGLFRGLNSASLSGTKGRIEWADNWVAFLDNMLQMEMLGTNTRGMYASTGIRKLVIDTKVHRAQVQAMPDGEKEFTVHVYRDLNIIVSNGVEIRGSEASPIPRRNPAGGPAIEEFRFAAHRDRAQVSLEVAIRIATQIVLENHPDLIVKTIEWIDENDDVSAENSTSSLIQKILGDLPLLQAEFNVIAPFDTVLEADLPPGITVSGLEILSGEQNVVLVTGYGLMARKNLEKLERLRGVMRDGGFLLTREPMNVDNDTFGTLKEEGFDIVLEKRTLTELVVLLRKREKLLEIAAIVRVTNREFTWLSKLKDAIKAGSEKRAISRSSRILVVSEGDFESGIMGMVICLRQEPGGEMIQGLLIQDEEAPQFSLDNPLYADQLKLGLALNVLRPKNSWGSYRFLALQPLKVRPVHHAQIVQLTRGDLSTLKWVEGRMQPSMKHDDLIKIHYSSLNFRDILIGTGKLNYEDVGRNGMIPRGNILGFEYAGRDSTGRAVMGMNDIGTMSNLCVCDRDLRWPIPDGWTLEDAATVPIVYGTAYLALKLCGEMKKGDKVLIHAGSGGVGQAAIRLALFEGCEVFTTVGTRRKREFIKTQFPQIDDNHIGNSRDTSFEQLILNQTEGRGVDIVLNSLAEEKLQASVRCLGPCGRFLEIGKFDMDANNNLGMKMFLKQIRFEAVLMNQLFTGPSERKTRLHALVEEGMKSGAVKPLVRTVFQMSQVEEAFRYMAAGKHIGKVLIKVRDGSKVKPTLPLALPRFYCSEERSYLVLGGLGGFGLELVDWLVLRGAKKIVLTSRRGISSGYQRLRINVWKSYGVEIVIVVGKDAWKQRDCEFILEQTLALGPVDAIFNLAVVLRDGLFENQTIESFEESLRVKAWATQQLDKQSRTLCPELRQFVVFSSAACGRGNAGQSNYGMANSIMERVCERRAAESLPGLAIQWGTIGDVGVVAETQEESSEIVINGTLQQRISSCLEELDGFMLRNIPVVSSVIVAEKKASDSKPTSIVDTVINIMGLKDLKTVSLHTPLAELGMDSMMAVEIRQSLERNFEVFLTPRDVRALTFAQLQEMSSKQSTGMEKCGGKPTNQAEDLLGISRVLRTLCAEELNKEPCIPLNTKSEAGRGEVFILPGIEGTHSVFQSLTSKLKSPTTCLQLGTTKADLTSIEGMADSLMPHLEARLRGRRDFVVAGYSFGSLVAIEIVRRLESKGLSGRLVLIDGSPDYLKEIAKQHLSLETEDQLQSNILIGITDVTAPSISSELSVELKSCNDWDDKLSLFIDKVKQNGIPSILTVEDQKALYSAFYYRLRAAISYNPSDLSPLRTAITLIKPTIRSLRSISEDYGLAALTREKVYIRYVKGNHVTMLDDDTCASAINGDSIQDTASIKNGDRNQEL